jgi:hypothetical protein
MSATNPTNIKIIATILFIKLPNQNIITDILKSP